MCRHKKDHGQLLDRARDNIVESSCQEKLSGREHGVRTTGLLFVPFSIRDEDRLLVSLLSAVAHRW